MLSAEDIQRLLGELIAGATSSGEVLDIYAAAGMSKPSLDDLTPELIAKTKTARNPQLAIEALRKLVAEESVATIRNNVVRQRAFSDAISDNKSAVDVLGTGVLADIARQLVSVMRRDIRTDWTVRDDVRAKLRSSIKRLLVLNGYPPDKQPGAIKLVMEQMESMAPRYAEVRAGV